MFIQSDNSCSVMVVCSAFWIRRLKLLNCFFHPFDRNVSSAGDGFMGHVDDSIGVSQDDQIHESYTNLEVFNDAGIVDLAEDFGVHFSNPQFNPRCNQVKFRPAAAGGQTFSLSGRGLNGEFEVHFLDYSPKLMAEVKKSGLQRQSNFLNQRFLQEPAGFHRLIVRPPLELAGL